MMDKDTEPKNEEETLFENPYRNILYCFVCGALMQFHTRRKSGKINRVTYVCSSWLKQKQCSRHRFDFYHVDSKIRKALQQEIHLAGIAAQHIESGDLPASYHDTLGYYQRQIARLLEEIRLDADSFQLLRKLLAKFSAQDSDVRFKEKQQQRISALRRSLVEIKISRTRAFEALACGEIDEDEYRQRMDVLGGEQLEFTNQLSNAETMCKMVDTHLSSENQWLRTFAEKGVVDELTTELVSCMIQRIDILEDKRVHITFNYTDCMRAFMTGLEAICDDDTGVS